MAGDTVPRRATPMLTYATAGGLALVALATGIDITVKAGISLLVIAPMATATIGRYRDAAVVAVFAIVASIPLGYVGDRFQTTAHWIAVSAVTIGSILAIAGARLRDRLYNVQRHTRAELREERRQRIRADLLAGIDRLIEPTSAPDDLLAALATLVVPDLADLCIVDLLVDDKRLVPAGIAGLDPEQAHTLRTMRAEFPLDLSTQHPAVVAISTREAQLLTSVGDQVVRKFAVVDEHRDRVRDMRYRSAVVAPVESGERTIGTVSLIRTTTTEPYDDFDLETANQLAARAGLVLDNARLFAEVSAMERRLDGTLANLAEAVTVRDRQGLVYVNQAAADSLGFASPAEMLAAPFPQMFQRWAYFGEDGEPFPVDRRPVVQVFAGEEPEPAVIRMVDQETGSERWMLSKASALRGERGEVAYAVTVDEDITDVKHAELSQRFLSNASKLLLTSQDVETTLEKVAWALVPEVADWSVIHLPDDRGTLRVVAFAHSDRDLYDRGDELKLYTPNDDSVIARVMRTGIPELVAHVPEGRIEGAENDEHSELLRELGIGSLAVVPLSHGGEALGVVAFVTIGDRHLLDWQLALVEELGRRAASVLESTRLHAAQSNIAATLQHSLLPPRLPAVPGLSVAARFRAAGVATEVGGDFYDLFPTHDGWLVVVGDVTGKGPSAAATTSLARYTLRTAAMYETEPARLLARLNQALVTDEDRRQLCTAVVVQVIPNPDGGGATVDIACAGHPPPYLLRAGDPPLPAGRPGTLLGAFEDTSYRSTRYELEPNDSLVLYTDGVTDTRGAVDRFGQDRLAGALVGLAGLEADEIAGHIDTTILDFEEGPQRDDVALLVLRCTPEHRDGGSLVAGAPTRARDAA